MNRFGQGQTPASSTRKKLKAGYYPEQAIKLDPPAKEFVDEYVEHVCGLQGFGRGYGSENDVCPACRRNKGEAGHE